MDIRTLINEAKLVLKKKILWITTTTVIVIIFTILYLSTIPTLYSAKSVFYPEKDVEYSGSPLEMLERSNNPGKGDLAIFSKVLSSRMITSIVAQNKIDKKYNKPYKNLAEWIIADNNKKKKIWETKIDYNKLSEFERIEMGASSLRNGCFTVFDESGFMSLVTNAYSSDLALAENDIIISTLIKFNFDRKTSKAKDDLESISRMVDSIGKVYENTKIDFAKFSDINKYMIKSVVMVPKEDLEEKKKILSVRYQKLVQMQEEAFVRFQKDKPAVDILDKPYIDGVKEPSKLFLAIVFGLISIILTSLFFIRNLFIDLIRSEISKVTAENNIKL